MRKEETSLFQNNTLNNNLLRSNTLSRGDRTPESRIESLKSLHKYHDTLHLFFGYYRFIRPSIMLSHLQKWRLTVSLLRIYNTWAKCKNNDTLAFQFNGIFGNHHVRSRFH